MTAKKSAFSGMVGKWPSSVVSRSEVGVFTGGLMTVKYQGNLDSAGLGPPRVRCGKKIAYPVAEYVAWLEGRLTSVKIKTPGRPFLSKEGADNE